MSIGRMALIASTLCACRQEPYLPTPVPTSPGIIRIFFHEQTDPGCLGVSLGAYLDHPDCSVESVAEQAQAPTIVIPACDNGKYPCFRVEHKAACADASPDGIGITIDRGGAPIPDHTVIRANCAFWCTARPCS